MKVEVDPMFILRNGGLTADWATGFVVEDSGIYTKTVVAADLNLEEKTGDDDSEFDLTHSYRTYFYQDIFTAFQIST